MRPSGGMDEKAVVDAVRDAALGSSLAGRPRLPRSSDGPARARIFPRRIRQECDVRSEMIVPAVRIADGADMLDGDLHVPENPAGIVIFAHGSGSSRFSSRNRHVAESLHRGRFATLLLDLLTREEEQIDIRTSRVPVRHLAAGASSCRGDGLGNGSPGRSESCQSACSAQARALPRR